MNFEDKQIKNLKDNYSLTNESLDSIKKNKSQFIGQLVHNLKNPVGSALSFSDMIIEDLESYSPDKLKRHLNIIKSSCEAALNQLDILLIESRLEVNDLDLNLQETLFSDLVKMCLIDNEKNLVKNNFTIQKHFLEDEFKIKLDRSIIKHTLHGLIQFLLLHSGNNATLNVDLKSIDDLFLLSLESNQCTNCDEKIKEFNFENSDKNNNIFNLNQEKFLNFKDISFIAQKHNGFLTLTKNQSNSLILTFAISTKL
jgi:K+-sensing histidine kinase KdpD